MAHVHPVYDTDKSFTIDVNTKNVKMKKGSEPAIAQYDHNSEYITFECDRFVEGHDLSLCDKVEVHYINREIAGRHSSRGVYEADDLQVYYKDQSKVIFSWLISERATTYAGILSFVVSFSCNDEGDLTYRWNTNVCNDLTVGESYDYGEAVVDAYADVLEMWKLDLFGIEETAEARMLATSLAQQEALDEKVQQLTSSIPEDYTELINKVDSVSAALDAVSVKVPMECTALTSDSSCSVVGVIGDGFNNVFSWNVQSKISYVYTHALMGKYSDYKDKILHVVMRNESENGMDLDNDIRIILSEYLNWGADFARFDDIKVESFPNGETITFNLDISSLPLVDNGHTFEDDSTLYFIIRHEMNFAFGNNNKIHFFCATSDKDSEFNSVGYVPSVNYAKEAFHAAEASNAVEALHAAEASNADYAAIAKTAIGAGYNTFAKESLGTYARKGEFCIPTYDEDAHTVKMEFTQLVNVEPNNTVNNVATLWLYGMAGFNIASLFGKGVKIYVKIPQDLDYTKYGLGYYIGQHSSQWGTGIYLRRETIPNGVSKLVFDIDNIAWNVEPDLTKTVYFTLYYERHYYPDEETGLCTTAADATLELDIYYVESGDHVIATELLGFDPDDYCTKEDLESVKYGDYITCWGDSLTAQGGWTNRLSELSGMLVYNGGTGGEGVKTIVARQGADVMMVNNIEIPETATAVTLATRADDKGLMTEFGNTVTPLLQGGSHINPCRIGDVEGTLKWTGSSYSDTTGTWTFTRSTAGSAVSITRPTALRTNYDMNFNSPYLMIIFIGQNGGYADYDDLIRWHRLMIEHSKARHVLVLGLSSGSANSRAEYEAAMRKEFGRYFISLREYLSTPIYDADGTIVNCYGLDDQDLTPTDDDLTAIASGVVPPSCLSDTVHYTSGTRTVIGNLIYKKCRELNIF